LNNVGVYMSSTVYSHGQLYVAISQVTGSANLKIFSGQGPNGYMWNVIYKEVLEMWLYFCNMYCQIHTHLCIRHGFKLVYIYIYMRKLVTQLQDDPKPTISTAKFSNFILIRKKEWKCVMNVHPKLYHLLTFDFIDSSGLKKFFKKLTPNTSIQIVKLLWWHGHYWPWIMHL